MSELLSNIVVIAAIAVSAAYATWRLGPRSLRQWLHAKYCQLFSIDDPTQANLSACDVCGACKTRKPAHRKAR
ncbi:MAG TPA: hypothetical protein VFS47_00990 [Steroidobacteraceae bacterium]|nr:hypothetical protein [Steroidobacteraceae bacterium]